MLEVVEGEPAGDDVELPVGERDVVNVAGPPLDVFGAMAVCQIARLHEHRLRGVQSDDILCSLGQRAGDGSWPAGQVDCPVS
jgi:hypothetical protein